MKIRDFKKQLFSLDIISLNFVITSKDVGYLKNITKSSFLYVFLSGFLHTFLLIGKTIIGSIIFVFFKKTYNKKKDVMVFVNSKKNFKLAQELKKINSRFISVSFRYNYCDYLLNKFYVVIFMLPFIFILFKRVPKEKYQRKIFFFKFYNFWSVYGLYIYFIFLLKLKKPNYVVFFNDHEYKSRTFLEAAKYMGVKTIFIQHATAANVLPFLEYDIAFLDGTDAYMKYRKSGISLKTKIIISGSFKYNFNSKKSNSKIIGISTNKLDGIDKTEELVEYLASRLPDYKVILRIHPIDKRKTKWNELIKKYKIYFSDSNNETMTEYLSRLSMHIACETNMHLEAVCWNVPSIYYQLQDPIVYDDIYGFIYNKLIKVAKCKDDLLPIILDDIIALNVKQRAKYFVNNIGTRFENNLFVLFSEVFDYSEIEKAAENHDHIQKQEQNVYEII